MVPRSGRGEFRSTAAPRTRGDGPGAAVVSRMTTCCSPHPRGWSRGPDGDRHRWPLLPAPAGMVPSRRRRSRHARPAPRTRGDGPVLGGAGGVLAGCSPHPRGWSDAGRLGIGYLVLLPAPAGMVPRFSACSAAVRPAPRTRGDGPVAIRELLSLTDCSPHPRGWSQDDRRAGVRRTLLPAPAGMVPNSGSTPPISATAPRTRGDGPAGALPPASAPGCSPHPRGWSHRRLVQGGMTWLLPAPAGMVPPWASTGRPVGPAPRTRGDGPQMEDLAEIVSVCSPHPRGWSHRG